MSWARVPPGAVGKGNPMIYETLSPKGTIPGTYR